MKRMICLLGLASIAFAATASSEAMSQLKLSGARHASVQNTVKQVKALTVSELRAAKGSALWGRTCTASVCYATSPGTSGPVMTDEGHCIIGLIGNCIGTTTDNLEKYNPGYACENNVHQPELSCTDGISSWCSQSATETRNCVGFSNNVGDPEEGECATQLVSTSAYTIDKPNTFCSM